MELDSAACGNAPPGSGIAQSVCRPHWFRDRAATPVRIAQGLIIAPGDEVGLGQRAPDVAIQRA